jgi:type IV pilus assembly protein PilF
MPRSRPQAGLAVAALFAACFALAGCKPEEGIRPIQKPDSTSKLKRDETAEDRARPFIQLGQKYMEMKKYDAARENLLKAIKYDPRNPDAHTVLATLYDKVGDPQAAEDNYRMAAEFAPKSGSANNNYGLYLCKRGKFDLSRRFFDVALADGFYDDKAMVYTNAGTCQLLGKGSLDVAEGDFRHALDLSPNNPQALYQLAQVLYQKNDFFKARAFIQRYEGLGEQVVPEALLLARNIEIKLGNPEAARDYARRLHDQFPDSEQARSLDALPSS